MRTAYLYGHYTYEDRLTLNSKFLKSKQLRQDERIFELEDIHGNVYFFDKSLIKDKEELKELEAVFNYNQKHYLCKFVKKNGQLKLLYFDRQKYTYTRKGKLILKKSKLEEDNNCIIIL